MVNKYFSPFREFILTGGFFTGIANEKRSEKERNFINKIKELHNITSKNKKQRYTLRQKEKRRLREAVRFKKYQGYCSVCGFFMPEAKPNRKICCSCRSMMYKSQKNEIIINPNFHNLDRLKKMEKRDLRVKLIDFIKNAEAKNKSGASFEEIRAYFSEYPLTWLREVIEELLRRGDLFEPRYNQFKVM